MTEYPKISVIIPVYNGEKFIEEAILSILNQNYSNKELIVVDDCSTDNSRKIISDLQIKYSFIYIENKINLGLAKNLNSGIKYANNPYLIFILQNDCVLKEKYYLAKISQHFLDDKSIGAITGKPEIKDFGKLKFAEKLNIMLFFNDIFKFENGVREINYIEGKADAYRYDIIREIGFFDENLSMANEDQIISRKIRDKGYKILQNNDLHYYLGYGGNQDRYLKVLLHLFKVAKSVPYVIKKYPFLIRRDDCLTKTRKLQRQIRFTHCFTLLLSIMIGIMAFIDIRFLFLFAFLFLWRIFFYTRLSFSKIRLNFIERIIYLITGIMTDYIYSIGMIYGTVLLFVKKKI